MDKDQCIRCGESMRFMMQEKIQLGQTDWILGDLGNLLAGAIKVDIYICSGCQKLEFYLSEENIEEKLPQVNCLNCGGKHDFDYPKCPHCGHVQR